MDANYDSMSPMRQLAWPAFAFFVATLLAVLLRAIALSLLRRWSALEHAVRVPSILWSIVLGIWAGNEVARQTEQLPSRLAGQVGVLPAAAVILSVTVTVSNVLTTLVQGASERRALGRPITRLGPAGARRPLLLLGFPVVVGSA